MTITSYFYDSVGGDKTYSAVDFGKAFSIIMENGIIPMDESGTLGFGITGTNYTTMGAGKATIEGHFIEVTGTETLTVPVGTYSGQVVLRVDFLDTRDATLVVKTNQTPTQDDSMYELPLWNVTVSNNIITAVSDQRIRGGAVAKLPDNVPYFFYRDNGVYLQIGDYSIALTPSQPPNSTKRVWIQIDN